MEWEVIHSEEHEWLRSKLSGISHLRLVTNGNGACGLHAAFGTCDPEEMFCVNARKMRRASPSAPPTKTSGEISAKPLFSAKPLASDASASPSRGHVARNSPLHSDVSRLRISLREARDVLSRRRRVSAAST